MIEKLDKEKRNPLNDLHLLDFAPLKIEDRVFHPTWTYSHNDPGLWRCLLGLFPLRDLTVGVAEVMHYGSIKYEWNNWRVIPNALNRYKAAALRHLYSDLYYPENPVFDPESGFPHSYHAACNIAFVLELWSEGGDPWK